MDAAQLRRIHYKLKVDPPTVEEYKEIFQRICESYGLEFTEDIFSYLVDSFYSKHTVPFAGFHPKFIAEHVVASCNYNGIRPQLTQDVLADALENMVILPTPALREA